MICKQLSRVESQRCGARKGVGGEHGTRVVLGAVDAVGVAGDGMDVRQAGEIDRERKQKLGATAAAPRAAFARTEGDRAFAAGDECDRALPGLVVRGGLARNGTE